eukprot:jgi/Psemu1/293366/fgenesh1_pg.2210_\
MTGNDETETQTTKPRGVLRPSSHKATKHNNNSRRGNEDELDDIDDWNEREDGDTDDINGSVLPSKSELIAAKRKRREQRGASGVLSADNDIDEAERSLAREGVKIEPFHMREEETDGTGYFDGDTYVFRRNVPAEDGEADAWADTLMQDGENEGDPAIGIARNSRGSSSSSSSLSISAAFQEDMDVLSKEELYKRVVPLLGDARETVMQAIQRVAKSHLDDLTGAANALLLKGEVDVYDTTKQGIFRMFPSLSNQPGGDTVAAAAAITQTSPKAAWEYQGNEDHQLHMVTTEQMIGWVRSGYFVGSQRVKIRTVTVVPETTQTTEKPNEQSLATQDDMLADLMDDDDDEEEESRPSKKAKESDTTTTIKGEWMWSDEVDYQKYL